MLITLKEAKEYLRIDSDEEDTLITSLIAAAEVYLKNATGKTFDSTNELARLFCLVLVVDWYENRSYIAGKVGALDEGTWRRLIVIPFQAKIEGSSEKKNYGDYLYENAGGAILSWIVEGAIKVIEDGYKIALPKVVEKATGKYRESNDWFNHFINECCEVEDGLIQKSGEFYQEYRAFSMRNGEFARSTTDFYTALEAEGFKRKRTNKGRFILGLRLKSEFL